MTSTPLRAALSRPSAPATTCSTIAAVGSDNTITSARAATATIESTTSTPSAATLRRVVSEASVPSTANPPRCSDSAMPRPMLPSPITPTVVTRGSSFARLGCRRKLEDHVAAGSRLEQQRACGDCVGTSLDFSATATRARRTSTSPARSRCRAGNRRATAAAAYLVVRTAAFGVTTRNTPHPVSTVRASSSASGLAVQRLEPRQQIGRPRGDVRHRGDGMNAVRVVLPLRHPDQLGAMLMADEMRDVGCALLRNSPSDATPHRRAIRFGHRAAEIDPTLALRGPRPVRRA